MNESRVSTAPKGFEVFGSRTDRFTSSVTAAAACIGYMLSGFSVTRGLIPSGCIGFATGVFLASQLKQGKPWATAAYRIFVAPALWLGLGGIFAISLLCYICVTHHAYGSTGLYILLGVAAVLLIASYIASAPKKHRN